MHRNTGSAEKKERAKLSPYTILKVLHKPVNGFAMVSFTGPDNGLGPVAVMQAIGIELGFQRNTGTLAVVNTVFALLVQIVAGIELDAGAVRMNFHGSAGNRMQI